MKIISTCVVHRNKEPSLFPGITCAVNGDLLVSFCTRFDCQAGGEAYLLRSGDAGRTWSEPRLILRSAQQQGCINLSVGLTTLQNGTILYPCCDARITRQWDQHDAELLILRSEDHGYTWSEPVGIGVEVKEPFAYGRIVQLSNGDLLCPIWGKRIAEEPWRSGLIRSRNSGLTWGDYRTIAYDPYATPVQRGSDAIHCAGFNETSLVELRDGRILAILRQQGVNGGRRELFRSVSTDSGWSWSKPEQLPLWGTSPSLHVQPSGRIMLGYRNHLGNPQGLPQPGVGISFSDDGGRSWRDHLLLEDPLGYEFQEEFDAGYPAFLTMPDCTVFVVFYSFDPSSRERYLAANVLN
jgi:hypothetical protein